MESNESASYVPPPLGPPPRIVPPTPPPPRRSRGWMIFALVLLVLLAISLMTNVGQWTSGLVSVSGSYSRTSGPRLEETVIEDHDASDKIAVVDIDGIIAGGVVQGGFNMVDVVKAQLKRAQRDDSVKAVVLRVDSPGGEVLAADQIYRAIEDFQQKANKPVITSMGSLAASGGYYVSAPSRWIVANQMTITGSIGVIMHAWNYRALMDKVGLRPEVFKSGKYKDMLSGEREPANIPPEERAMVQSLIDETYGRFTNVVAKGRAYAHEENKNEGRELVSDWPSYADGRVFSGSEAYKLGFVDEVGTFQDAVKRAEDIAGIPSANLVQYRARYDLSDFLHLFGKSQAPVIKVDLGVDVPNLKAGQLYFLWPTFGQ